MRQSQPFDLRSDLAGWGSSHQPFLDTPNTPPFTNTGRRTPPTYSAKIPHLQPTRPSTLFLPDPVDSPRNVFTPSAPSSPRHVDPSIGLLSQSPLTQPGPADLPHDFFTPGTLPSPGHVDSPIGLVGLVSQSPLAQPGPVDLPHDFFTPSTLASPGHVDSSIGLLSQSTLAQPSTIDRLPAQGAAMFARSGSRDPISGLPKIPGDTSATNSADFDWLSGGSFGLSDKHFPPAGNQMLPPPGQPGALLDGSPQPYQLRPNPTDPAQPQTLPNGHKRGAEIVPLSGPSRSKRNRFSRKSPSPAKPHTGHEWSIASPLNVVQRPHLADAPRLNGGKLGDSLKPEDHFLGLGNEYNVLRHSEVHGPTPWDVAVGKLLGISPVEIGTFTHIIILSKLLPGIAIFEAALYPQHSMMVIRNPTSEMWRADLKQPERPPMGRLLYGAIMQHPWPQGRPRLKRIVMTNVPVGSGTHAILIQRDIRRARPTAYSGDFWTRVDRGGKNKDSESWMALAKSDLVAPVIELLKLWPKEFGKLYLWQFKFPRDLELDPRNPELCTLEMEIHSSFDRPSFRS